MRLEATFIRLDLEAVGYQFTNAQGQRIGQRITSGIVRDPVDTGRFFTLSANPPAGAVGVIWDDSEDEDAVVAGFLPASAPAPVPDAPDAPVASGASEFADLMLAGHAEMLGQAGVTLAFEGRTAKVVPGNSAVSFELKAAGLWEQGSQVVEIRRTDYQRLGLADRDVVTLAGKPMALFVVEDDPADPMLRLHLKPTHQ